MKKERYYKTDSWWDNHPIVTLVYAVVCYILLATVFFII